MKYYSIDKTKYYPINTISEDELKGKIRWLENWLDRINKLLPDLFGDYSFSAKKDKMWINEQLKFLHYLKETLNVPE